MQPYKIYNPTDVVRTVKIGGQVVPMRPGEVRSNVMLDGRTAEILRRRDMVVVDPTPAPVLVPPLPAIVGDKEPLLVTGHLGIGDGLHQRAVIRELMRSHDVWLETPHHLMYWDLKERGLRLLLRHTTLRAQARTIERERHLFTDERPPAGTRPIKIAYPKTDIDRYGSILEAMFGSIRTPCPLRPDFSLPLKDEWIEAGRQLMRGWDTGGRPVMVYRPIVVRREWDGANRNCDDAAYWEIYHAIKERFFTVSIADLAPGLEWIVGLEAPADVKYHRGELSFQEMAAIFKAAALVLTPAGFGPVLAQAVGTPSITVYGGRESYRTTQRMGAHLAPTLPIDVDYPCDCHTNRHNCRKKITLPPALAKVREFTDQVLSGQARPVEIKAAAEAKEERRKRTLIFATVYVDCEDRRKLTDQWLTLHTRLNQDYCDFLLVDSASPVQPICGEKWQFIRYEKGMSRPLMLYDFGDNVGHLSRGGRDGWGRAFCWGLQAAIDGGYDYAVHIEGDSLFRLGVGPIIEEMRLTGGKCLSTPVVGMRSGPQGARDWVETGLMMFETKYLRESDFIRRYDWQRRGVRPTPEVVIYRLLGQDLRMMPWRTLRNDKNHGVNHQNVVSKNLDWITHFHSDIWAYDRFLEANLPKEAATSVASDISVAAPSALIISAPVAGLRLNLGCGDNKLAGWENHDADVDISKPLPWKGGVAAYILAEHVVEHVGYYDALKFFGECRRVLRAGGVLRVCVPSIEQIMRCGDGDYYRFTQKWQKLGATARGAMDAILHAHGHRAAWTASLLECSLVYCGFTNVVQCRPHQSEHAELRGVEGHHKVIGEKFNTIESCIFEGTVPQRGGPPVAIVVGGAESALAELKQAEELCGQAGSRYETFVVNDMVAVVPRVDHMVTLHPDRLRGREDWLGKRERAGYGPVGEVWAHRSHRGGAVNRWTADWGGSVGLFAVKVARELGFERIILCGVPMRTDGGHHIRRERWDAAEGFWQKWAPYISDLKRYVRSYSGQTRDVFGEPEERWVNPC
jgi:hypothetical protein